jgi:hypothetical protein
LLIVPTLIAIGALYGKAFLKMLFSRYAGVGLLLFLAFGFAYYYIRTQYDPGYWRIAWVSEFTRLTEDVQPWMHYPFSFYFEHFYDPYFQEYLLLMAALVVPYFIIGRNDGKRIVAAFMLVAGVYLLTISLPPVKLAWYDAPAYPIACASLGLIISGLVKACRHGKKWALAGSLVTLVVTCVTIRNSFRHVEEELSEVPHLGLTHQTVPDGLKIMHDRHPANHFAILLSPTEPRYAHNLDELTFYKTLYEWKEHKTIRVSDRPGDYGVGDTIICSREMLPAIETSYRLTRIDSTQAGAMWVRLD